MVQLYRITLTRLVLYQHTLVVATTSKECTGLPNCVQCFQRTKRSKFGLLYLQPLAVQCPSCSDEQQLQVFRLFS
ncbi:hypothetical protein SEVIR_3G133625v4 [Setaria viridis]